jgi:hypothetical protein
MHKETAKRYGMYQLQKKMLRNEKMQLKRRAKK